MRKRTDPDIIRYGMYLYFNSRSFRLAARSLSPIRKRSHVSIWKWVQKYSSLADRFRTDRRLVGAIFVDETLLQIDGIDYWLWIAYEPAINTCLMMHLSRERTLFVCYRFFKQLQNRYGRKPIFTDGARWYNDACRWLRLRHYVYGTELKNIMERFVQHIKDRTECVLMTIFHAGKRIATGSMCGTGSGYSCCICMREQTECDLLHSWPGMAVKLTEPAFPVENISARWTRTNSIELFPRLKRRIRSLSRRYT